MNEQMNHSEKLETLRESIFTQLSDLDYSQYYDLGYAKAYHTETVEVGKRRALVCMTIDNANPTPKFKIMTWSPDRPYREDDLDVHSGYIWYPPATKTLPAKLEALAAFGIDL